eukprot:7213306-Alexandrium_andersonii.AAC.1
MCIRDSPRPSRGQEGLGGPGLRTPLAYRGARNLSKARFLTGERRGLLQTWPRTATICALRTNRKGGIGYLKKTWRGLGAPRRP